MILQTQIITNGSQWAILSRTGKWYGRAFCAICSVCLTKRHKCKEQGQSLFESTENAQKMFNPSYRRQSWNDYKKNGLRKCK